MDDVQYYTSSPTSSKEPVYALAIISSVTMHAEKMTYMVDKVAKVNEEAKLPDIERQRLHSGQRLHTYQRASNVCMLSRFYALYNEEGKALIRTTN